MRVLLLLFVLPAVVWGQVDVAQLTLKIGAASSKSLYYGFEKGDQIIFSCDEVQNKAVKEVEIIRLPSQSVFMDFKFKSVGKQFFSVEERGVYQFRFSNNSLAKRIIKLKIQRLPESELTKNFNTGWKWLTTYDTVLTHYQEDSLVGYDSLPYTETVKEKILDSLYESQWLNKSERVHSYWNSNPSKTYVKVDLPKNVKTEEYSDETVIWAYWIGVGQEGQEAYKSSLKAMVKAGVTVASTSTLGPAVQSMLHQSPLTEFAAGIIGGLVIPTVGENVRYYFINNVENANAFVRGEQFYFFDKGNGVAGYGKNDKIRDGSFYIGLYNDNQHQGIDVELKIVAIRRIQMFKDKTYQRVKVEPRFVSVERVKRTVTSKRTRVNQ